MKGWPWRKITVGRTEGVNNIHNRENPKISPDLNHDDKWRPAQQIQNLRIPDYPGTEITGKSCGSPAGEDTPSAADMVGCLPAENNAFFPQDSVSLFSVFHRGSPCRSSVTILETTLVL